MALVALQASFSTEASSALSERCARFQNNPYLDRAVAFTHVPKAGGTSYQQMLVDEATDFKRVCNLHQLDRLTATADCDLLIGHANAAFELQGFEWQGNPKGSFLTIFRQPAARAESLFRYQSGRGQEYVADVLARNGSLQHEYERFLDQVSTGAAWMHAPPDLFPQGADLNTWGRGSGDASDPSSDLSSDPAPPTVVPMSQEQLEQVLTFIARRYSAVGVLERPEDTAEVLRCRLPWFHAKTLPHSLTNAQTWAYPVNLTADPELMRRHTAVEQSLYEWADQLLTADLECCRSRRQTNSTSS